MKNYYYVNIFYRTDEFSRDIVNKLVQGNYPDATYKSLGYSMPSVVYLRLNNQSNAQNRSLSNYNKQCKEVPIIIERDGNVYRDVVTGRVINCQYNGGNYTSNIAPGDFKLQAISSISSDGVVLILKRLTKEDVINYNRCLDSFLATLEDFKRAYQTCVNAKNRKEQANEDFITNFRSRFKDR